MPPSSTSASDSPESPARRPAWVLVDSAAAHLRVAALPLLDRLLVALHRAGCHPITLATREPLPPLPRSRAWNIAFETSADLAGPPPGSVALHAEALVEAADLRRLLAAPSPSRLTTPDGKPLPVATIGSAPTPADLASHLTQAQPLPARGVACAVRTPAEARAATKTLWASITSSSDGFVDRFFNRPAGRPLSRLLIHTPVTPNAISIVSILIGVASALLFAVGQHTVSILAALLFQVSAIIDCVDGDVARSVFKESPLGKWIDLVGDQVVHLSVFAGIAAGLLRAGHGMEAGWLGLSAAVGAALSFAVVLRGLRRARRRGTDDNRMQRILDAVTNRDFSVLVLALAIADRLPWFLWMAGIGSHVFWIGLLVLQSRTPNPDPASR